MRSTSAVSMAVLAMAFCASSTHALCPNSCSEKGVCAAFDRCTCYPGYTEGDCSGRLCPYGASWADKADTTVTGREPHYYAECSGKGDCDREKGECECHDGFEGKACQRMSCQDKCNGHGVCQTMADANSGYAGWDKDMLMVCVCDPGWTGVSCNQRMCPKGDDPMSVYDASGSQTEVDEVQEYTITLGANTDTESTFIMGYTDWRGEKLWTHPIEFPPTAIGVREALQALPNHAIPSVTTSVSETTPNQVYVVRVTFTDMDTPGDQPDLDVQVAGCYVHGCQPVYYGVYSGTRGAVAGVAKTANTQGTAERSECSSRGTCNYETGVCECFDGYYGYSCNRQTIIM